MQNKHNTSSATGLVNGSMAVTKQAAKVRKLTRKRHFLSKVAVRSSSTQVLSASQSLYPVGSQYSVATMLFAADQLSTNAQNWIQMHDKYRIAEIEVFATLTSASRSGSVDRTAPVEIFFYEDTDADPSTTTSWIRVSDRDNLGRVVLHATQPSKRLITFKPTTTFSAGAGDQAPSNVVPKKDCWLDALAINQLYSGLRLFSACAQTDGQGQSYEYQINLEARYTVECQQPL